MKMGFLFSGLFWGIIIVLIGISIIVKVLFKVNIPVVRLVFGLIVIYIGLRILFGGSCFTGGKNKTLFAERKINIETVGKKYETVFGRSIIDLSSVKLEKEETFIDMDTVFGSTLLKLGKDLAVRLVVNAVFASATTPDGNQVSFGEHTYESATFKKAKQRIVIKADVVFGNLEVKLQ